ncbi:unnamed protein product, partial [Closterium sp. Naga37s-1]
PFFRLRCERLSCQWGQTQPPLLLSARQHRRGTNLPPTPPLPPLPLPKITASGRRLPKAYVRSVTALISSLRDALGAEEGDRGEVRRKAEVAKGAIRAYLGEWRGKAPENTEIITSSLDSLLRTLSRFYMRSGVNAKLPADVRDGILAELALAEAAL